MTGLRLACLDMAGTTVRDEGLVESAFTTAMRALGVPDPEIDAGMDYVRRTMGLPKEVVFRALLHDERRAADAVAAFDEDLLGAIGDGAVSEIPGATGTLRTLKSMGLAVCLTTGFTAEVQSAIVESCGWRGEIDLAIAPSEGVRGRPFPDMIFAALMRLGFEDVREVVVVGDTTNDLVSGSRAGATAVIGVLTGAHGSEELQTAPHTHIVESVVDVPDLIG